MSTGSKVLISPDLTHHDDWTAGDPILLMYALAFDLIISNLKEHYGEPYNNAYFEIKELLKKDGFEWVQGGKLVKLYGPCTKLIDSYLES